MMQSLAHGGTTLSPPQCSILARSHVKSTRSGVREVYCATAYVDYSTQYAHFLSIQYTTLTAVPQSVLTTQYMSYEQTFSIK
jgi:hypothetical protein